MTAEAAARGRRNRSHGHATELMVVKYLREQGWPDTCTTRAKLGHAGTHTPGDISWHPLVVLEVKSRADSRWPSWCRQALAETPAGCVPAVVRRTRGVADVGQWECRVHGNGWVAAMGLMPYHAFHGGVAAADAYTLADGHVWHHVRFAKLVAAVRRIDQDGAA